MRNSLQCMGIGYRSIKYKYIFKNFHIPYAIIPLYFLLTSGLFAQTKTNLEVFYTLVDSSVHDFVSQIPQSEDSVKLDINLGQSYSVFNNKIIGAFYSSGKNIAAHKEGTININYIVDGAAVSYGEIFRDGFFGDYYIPRNLSLKGNYLIGTEPVVFKDFNFSSSDTIRLDDIKYIENESFPFTKGEVPSEPFFSGLFEPVVAIGTAAVAVILFFTIRSK